MLIARRADTRARADFATWKMLAKLNGASALPQEAQAFLESYKALLKQMSEAEATEATIKLMYKAYYGDMGGRRATSRRRPTRDPKRPAKDNVTAFKRPPAQRKPPQQQQPTSGSATKPRLPVALIFACLVLVYVAIRYFWP